MGSRASASFRPFAKILGRPVRIAAVPREAWGGLFTSQALKDPVPRIQMLDGFNEGWIEIERGELGRDLDARQRRFAQPCPE
jgi:hypothetical protein